MNPVFVYAVAGLAAASTLYGLLRFFGRRGAASEERAGGVDGPEMSEAGDGRGGESADPREADRLEILSRKRVGIGCAIVVVRVGERRLLLGVTRGQWTALADLGMAPRDGRDSASAIEAELNRALIADRFRRGRRAS